MFNKKGVKVMKFDLNVNGITKLVKWGLPIAGLIVFGPIGMIVGLVLSGCVNISSK